MGFKTSKEKKAFRIGLFSGLRKKKSLKNNKSKGKNKTFLFQAFDYNCDIFNVSVKGKNRESARKYAQNVLNKDKYYKNQDVVVTKTPGNTDEYFVVLNIDKDGKVNSNFPKRK